MIICMQGNFRADNSNMDVLLSTTILPSLVVIVKRNVEIWAKLLTSGLDLASSLRMGLDGKINENMFLCQVWNETAT